MSALTITQARSSNGANKKQLDTLRSLGLRRIGHTVQVDDCAQSRGMVHSVRHLVEIEGAKNANEAQSSPGKGAKDAKEEAKS